MLGLTVVGALLTAAPLIRGFRAFDREASSLHTLAVAAADRPVIMGLMYDSRSRVVHHPVYLHAAAELARERGGIPNYCLAGWRQAPIRYRVAPPPSLPWEWRPDLFDYASMGAPYDHFLGRGVEPERVFGDHLGRELYVAARAGDFWLVRRGR